MRTIRDLISGNQYESMRFATQMCNITIEDIKKSLDSTNAIKASNGKLYKFREVFNDPRTARGVAMEKIPFGKYKGMRISECDDIPYLQWLVKLDNLHARLRVPIRNRIKELK